MHCSIVYQFNQKTPEKTVNRKSLVVFNFDLVENNIIKELGVYKDGQTVGYSFLLPEKFKATSQTFFETFSWSQLEQRLRKRN